MLSLVGCSTPSSTLTPLQRRVMEAKELEGSYDDAFKATLAVLQDRQYNVKTSDYQGGIVYAESQMQPAPNPSTLAKLTILYTNKNDFPFRMKTTVTFEKFTDKITKVRFTIYKEYPPGANYGTGVLEEPDEYQALYADIQKEMFRRAQLNK